MHYLEPCGFEHFLRRLLHVLGHAVLVFSKLIVKTQRWNAPFVFHRRIEFNKVFVTCQHFAKPAHPYECALILANLLLKVRSKTVRVSSTRKHGAAATAFKSVAADEFGMFFGQVAKSGQIKATGSAVIKCRGLADKISRATGYSWPHDVLAEIVADVPAGVCQAVRMQSRLRE